MRRDKISTDPLGIPPREKREVAVPAPPPGARYGVIVNKVSNNPRLSGRDVTQDFTEFTLDKGR